MIKVAWSPIYVHPLPENHRFPMAKYDLLPKQLLYEGTLTEENFFEPEKVSEEHILAIHDLDYWNKLKKVDFGRQEELRSGFPITEGLVERELVITEGTRRASLYALEHDVAFNIAGGTHHAFANRAEGFCLLNDMAIAASYLLKANHCKQILVVDLDVHQGNGTAKIFENDSRVFTLSMHGAHNYPLRKEKSDLDIELPDKISGTEYLSILKSALEETLLEVNPDFVFFQSGVDVLESDKLGRLALSIDDCKKRDKMVFSKVIERQIPIMVSMGGGYSKDINSIVEAHANTYRLAVDLYT